MKDKGSVVTVCGPISPAELGICTTHEHLFFDWIQPAWEEPETPEAMALGNSDITLANRGTLNRSQMVIKDNLVHQDIGTAIQEVRDLKKAGGGGLVDTTPAGRGRNPGALRGVSEQTGVHIIMSTGFYTQAGHPPYLSEKSVDELAATITQDINTGADGTDVRAGYMGDVGTTGAITDGERRVLRACARAHLETGVAIGVHVDPADRQALSVTRILLEEGVKPDRIVLEHMDEQLDEDYHLLIADTGVYLEFSSWGSENHYSQPYTVPMPRDLDRAKQMKFLIDRGYVSQLLIGQDVWVKTLMKKYGGEGYDSFLVYGVPTLKRFGVTEEQINTILVDNPGRILAISV